MSKQLKLILSIVTSVAYIALHSVFMLSFNLNNEFWSGSSDLFSNLLNILRNFFLPLILIAMTLLFIWAEDESAALGYILSAVMTGICFLCFEADGGAKLKYSSAYFYYAYMGAMLLGGIYYLYSFLFIKKAYGYKHPLIFFYILPMATAIITLISPYVVINLFHYENDTLPMAYFFLGLGIIVAVTLMFWLFLGATSGSSGRSSHGSSSYGSGKKFTNSDVWHMVYGLSAGDGTVGGKVTDVRVRGEYSSERLNSNFDIVLEIEINVRPSSFNTQEGIVKMANRVVDSIFSQAERKLQAKGVGYSLETDVNVRD